MPAYADGERERESERESVKHEWLPFDEWLLLLYVVPVYSLVMRNGSNEESITACLLCSVQRY